jgi:hypothetical protein
VINDIDFLINCIQQNTEIWNEEYSVMLRTTASHNLTNAAPTQVDQIGIPSLPPKSNSQEVSNTNASHGDSIGLGPEMEKLKEHEHNILSVSDLADSAMLS